MTIPRRAPYRRLNQNLSLLLLLLAFLAAPTRVGAETAGGDPTRAFLQDLAARAAAAQKANTTVVRGSEGWLFFAPELRHLTVGPFWGPAAIKVSHADKPEWADPLPAILDFKDQLDKAGIQLLLVPVPAKAVIYPEKVSSAIRISDGGVPSRLDIYDQQFYTLLAQNGVKVLDLTPVFLQDRYAKEGYLYCQQDTHWSGRACELTARLIVDQLKDAPWLKSVPIHKYQVSQQNVSITGDLWGELNTPALPKEHLNLNMVREQTANGMVPVAPSRDSPVVLLGDSHDLVFHAGGDMLAEGAGLADQLALRLGFPVDLVAVRGSGATPSRVNLLRRRDNMAGKKVVIWCFTTREFTESQGWRKVPVIRPVASDQ